MRLAAAPVARGQDLTIGSVSVMGGTRTHPLGKPQISADAFRKALELSLRDAKLLDSTNAGTGHQLLVSIVGVTVRSHWFSTTFEASATVSYRLVTPDGRTVLDKLISSEAEAGFRDAPLGPTRSRVVQERAMRNNIARFLELLWKREVQATP